MSSEKAAQAKKKVVQVPRDQTAVFPKDCPRCLKPTETTFGVRQSEQRRFGLGWKSHEFQVPICDECLNSFKTKAWVINRVLRWSLVGIALGLIFVLEGATRWVVVIAAAIGSGIARQYNPSGIAVTSYQGSPWLWHFPSEEYAAKFAEANGVAEMADVAKKSEESPQ